MVNKNLLKSKIVAKGKTIRDFCTDTGISQSTFNRHMTNSTFGIDDVSKMAAYLGLSYKDITDIFFAK